MGIFTATSLSISVPSTAVDRGIGPHGEHAFHVIKHPWGFMKVRCRDLAKNTARAVTMFALVNLYRCPNPYAKVPLPLQPAADRAPRAILEPRAPITGAHYLGAGASPYVHGQDLCPLGATEATALLAATKTAVRNSFARGAMADQISHRADRQRARHNGPIQGTDATMAMNFGSRREGFGFLQGAVSLGLAPNAACRHYRDRSYCRKPSSSQRFLTARSLAACQSEGTLRGSTHPIAKAESSSGDDSRFAPAKARMRCQYADPRRITS